MNKIKKGILCSIFCSSVLFSSNITEFTVGLNDKLGYFGPFSKSWIKEKDKKESYIVAGGLGLLGGVGYGQKYYFSKGFFSPYFSLTGFGFYFVLFGEYASLGVSSTLGFDMTPIKWKKKEIILQFGMTSLHDLISGENLTIGGNDGPPFFMPSFNIKLINRK